MLRDFIATNRTVLLGRCRDMVSSRSDRKATDEELAHGIPMFLDQLIETLVVEEQSGLESTNESGSARGSFPRNSATRRLSTAVIYFMRGLPLSRLSGTTAMSVRRSQT